MISQGITVIEFKFESIIDINLKYLTKALAFWKWDTDG